MRFRSLKDIGLIRVKQEQDKSPKKEEPRTKPDNPEELFARAMQGVTPLDGKGRQISSPKEKPARPPRRPQENTLDDIVKGRVEFAIDYTDEYMQAHVLGMDSRIFRRLQQGRYSVESHLDLHGLKSEQ
ncbi:MAG: Smr/MutS family protein, partial [Desulfovibrionales bacterium]